MHENVMCCRLGNNFHRTQEFLAGFAERDMTSLSTLYNYAYACSTVMSEILYFVLLDVVLCKSLGLHTLYIDVLCA